MTLRVGQKVVCVDDSPLTDGKPHPFKCGVIQTIERIGHCGGADCCGLVFDGVALVYGRWLYCSLRWRPIVERKTDISVFTNMLKSAKVRA